MGTVRINLNGDSPIFNNVMQAFIAENGYPPEAYAGYYSRQALFESELSGWLSSKGYPCVMYGERNTHPTSTTTAYDHIGLQMEAKIATLFLMKWS
jgi:hypothetical protein